MTLRRALKSQYHAGLAMLRGAIERCPDEAWDDGRQVNRFWHLAYHTLFYTDFYLCRDAQAFTPWEFHRQDLNFLAVAPGDPPKRVTRGEPLSRRQILDYWNLVEARVDDAVDAIDLDATESGFWWYQMPKLEHQLVNLRHLQHHTAQLVERVRQSTGSGVAWVGGVPARGEP